MFCDCGQTYVVNDDGGVPGARRKKDSSFRSIITVMFVVLLVYIAIYCLILTINKKRAHTLENPDSKDMNEDLPSREVNDRLYGRLRKNVTEKAMKLETTTKVVGVDSTKDYETQKDREDDKNWTQTSVISTTNGGIEANIIEKNGDTTKGSIEEENKEHTIEYIKHTTVRESAFASDKSTTEPIFTNNDNDIAKLYTTVFNIWNEGSTYSPEDTDTSATTPEKVTTSRILDVEQAKTTVGSDKSNVQVQTKEWNIVPKTTERHSNNGFTTLVPKTVTTTVISTYSGNEPETSANVHQKQEKPVTTTDSYVDRGQTVYRSEYIERATVTWSENATKEQEITTINTVTEKQAESNREQYIQSTTVNAALTHKHVTTSRTHNNEKETAEAMAEEALIKLNTINENYVIITSASPIKKTSEPNEFPQILVENVTTPSSVYKITENSQQNNLIPKDTKRICSSPECKGKASAILGRMAHSADPCEDFYQFSCEGRDGDDNSIRMQKADVLLEFLYKTKTTDDLQTKSFKKFFESCVEYENKFGYSAKIQQVSSSNIRTNNLTTLLAFLMLRQTAPLFDVRMGFVGNKEGYGLQVLPPGDYSDSDTLRGWSLQSHIERECVRNSGKLKYEAEVDLQNVYEQFEECRNETFAQKINDFVNLQKDGKKQYGDNVLGCKFLLNKAEISTGAIQKALSDRLYKKTDVAYLNRKYSSIDWRVLFGKILCTNFDTSMPIYLYMEETYFEPLMKDLNKRLADNEEEILNAIKLYYQLQLYENVVSLKDNVDYFCVEQASSLMPEIAENIFVRSNTEITVERQRFETTFEELKEKFYWLIDISNMDEAEKNQFKKQLGLLKLATFKAETVKNMFVEKYHDYITGDYLSNLFMLLEDKRSINTREDFVRNLHASFQNFDNPKVIPNKDTIVVPNKFIYRIIKNKNMPLYVSESYAKFHLGRAIAIYMGQVARRLELTFQVQFQKTLNRYLEGMDADINWKNKRLSYKNNYELWTSAIDASTSDRMADNIALQIAFGSIFPQNESSPTLPWISEDYNSEKQFFILVVQEYCESLSLLELARNLFGTPNMPGVFRTSAMIANSREFETAFNCPLGSRMNPPDKVEYTIFIPDDYTNYANNYDEQLSK